MRRLFREVSFFVELTSLDNVILGSQLAQTISTRRALERARTLWPERSTGALYYKVNDFRGAASTITEPKNRPTTS